MHWRAYEQTAHKWEILRRNPNGAARGKAFELFLAELFGHEHFRVTADFFADGRQVDLFVVRRDVHLLVEAKWTKKRTQQDVIDGLQARLASAPPGVVGLVVSMSGFTPKVIERVERLADRPILLMDGWEVEQVVARGGLYALVRSKMDALARSRKAIVGKSAQPDGLPWLVELPESGLKIVDPQGREHSWWESRGDFAQQVSSLVSPDSRWARPNAVRLDMIIGVREIEDLIGLLRRLAQLGFVSSEGTWRIEQSGVVWSGLGPAELGRQLVDWAPRYRDRLLHSSELIMYVDESDEGMFALTADVSVKSKRLVRWCELSFLLPGVPLDPSPYESIVAELPVLNTPSFDVVGRDPITRQRLGNRGKPRRTTPLAYLVRDEPSAPTGRPSVRWVEGIVAVSPRIRYAPESRIDSGMRALRREETFVRLRQQHHLGDRVAHELLWATVVETSHASVLSVVGDWVELGASE